MYLEPIEHPDITEAMRTGYPFGTVRTPCSDCEYDSCDHCPDDYSDDADYDYSDWGDDE